MLLTYDELNPPRNPKWQIPKALSRSSGQDGWCVGTSKRSRETTTWSPVANDMSVRIFLTYCVKKDLILYQADIISAYLHALLRRPKKLVSAQHLRIRNSSTGCSVVSKHNHPTNHGRWTPLIHGDSVLRLVYMRILDSWWKYDRRSY